MWNTLASPIVKKLRPSFDELLQEDASGNLFVFDRELGDRASCCTTGEVACLYVLDDMLHDSGGRDIAKRLVQDVRRRQLPSGAFGQPYYVKRGEPSTIDIAEIGAVANSLYHVYRQAGCEEARDSLIAAADYLLTQIAREQPGAVYKNPNAMEHDVLNGDVYAAHTWGRAYEVTGNEVYLRKAWDVITHVGGRFGKNAAGWWPYIERWDGTVGMGNSVAYQGTIVGFAHTVLPLLPEPLRQSWEQTAWAAARTMLAAMKDGPTDDNEAPWWCRDWRNAWEIYLAFSRFPSWPEAADAVAGCLTQVDRELAESGAARFQPAGPARPDPERSPVTTTFRKSATFAGILAYMMLDPEC